MIKNRKEVTLSEIMDFKNGLNFTKSDNGEKIKIVGVSDFKDLAELHSTDNLDVISISSKIKDDELLKDGDLLFVRSNGKELLNQNNPRWEQVKLSDIAVIKKAKLLAVKS